MVGHERARYRISGRATGCVQRTLAHTSTLLQQCCGRILYKFMVRVAEPLPFALRGVVLPELVGACMLHIERCTVGWEWINRLCILEGEERATCNMLHVTDCLQGCCRVCVVYSRGWREWLTFFSSFRITGLDGIFERVGRGTRIETIEVERDASCIMHVPTIEAKIWIWYGTP